MSNPYHANHLLAQLRAASLGREDATFAQHAGGNLTYGDLFTAAEKIAAALVNHGLEPGDRVAVQVEKSLNAIALYLGTVLAGGVFLPLNTAYTPREIEYFTGNAEPKIFICDPASQASLAGATQNVAQILTLDAAGEGSLIDAANREQPGFAAVPRGAEDLAAILYTSGTTGRSKGAMLSHRALASNSATLIDVWRFTSDDVLIHALPIYHTHGLFVATNVTLFAGSSIIFMAKFNADSVIEAMPRATAMMGVPTFYTRLLAHPGFTREVTENMRLFISGSAPLLAETHNQFSDVTGHAILERYGMTETNMNTSNPYDGDRRAGTVGFPLPDVDLRITNPDTGEALRDGDIGIIEVKGPNLFSGYWRMPEKTAEEFRDDGFFITGDMGVIDERGYVSIVGRAKDLIISGGFNVYPKEIESLIDDLPGINETAVIGVPHPDFGEAVVAAVVLNVPNAQTSDSIKQSIAPNLAKFKQPKAIFIVDELPRNTMGKVQKNVLRDRYKSLFENQPA